MYVIAKHLSARANSPSLVWAVGNVPTGIAIVIATLVNADKKWRMEPLPSECTFPHLCCYGDRLYNAADTNV